MATEFLSEQKPGGYVTQTLTAQGATVARGAASLPLIIVGQKINIEDNIFSGVYAGEGTQYVFPNYETAAKIKVDSVVPELRNIVLSVEKSDTNNIVYERASATYVSEATKEITITGIGHDLREGDLVSVEYPVTGTTVRDTGTIDTSVEGIDTTITLLNALDTAIPDGSTVAVTIRRSYVYNSTLAPHTVTAKGASNTAYYNSETEVHTVEVTGTVVTVLGVNDLVINANDLITLIFPATGTPTATLIRRVVSSANNGADFDIVIDAVVSPTIVDGSTIKVTVRSPHLMVSSADVTGELGVNDTVLVEYPVSGSPIIQLNAVIQAFSLVGGNTYIDLNTSLPSLIVGSAVKILTRRPTGVIRFTSTDVLEDTSRDLSEAFVGDIVTLYHPTYGNTSASVIEILDANRIRLNKDFISSSNVFGITYEVTRARATFNVILQNQPAIFTLNIGETETDIIQNISASVNYENVKTGDQFRIIQGSNIQAATVINVIDSSRVQLSKKFGAIGCLVTVTRTQTTNAPYILTSTQYSVDDADSDGYADIASFNLEGSITIPEVDGILVKSADVYISYLSESVKDAGVNLEVSRDDLIEEVCGKYDIRNPMGIAGVVAGGNTGTAFSIVPVGSNDLTGFQEALAKVQSMRAHVVVGLTQDDTINDLIVSHVDAVSIPTLGRWRVSFINRKHPFEAVIVPYKAGGILSYVASPVPYFELYDPVANFADMRVEGYVRIVADVGSGVFTTYLRVNQLVNSSKMRFEPYFYNVPTGLEAGEGVYSKGVIISSTSDPINTTEIASPIDVSYEAFYRRTKTEQAQAQATIAASYGNRRVNLIPNAKCAIGNDVLPGYYYNVAYGALSSGTFPHQGLTNVPINIIGTVYYGYDYYDEIQVGIVAAGGNWQVLQDDPNSQPYAFRQKTTDGTTLKTTEYSITKNLDEISYAVQEAKRGLHGKSNVTQEAIDNVTGRVQSVIDARSRNSVTSIYGFLGKQIITYGGVSYQQSDILDRIMAKIPLTLPTPMNIIETELVV